MCVQSLSVTCCLSYRPTFLSFFHSLTCWQDIYFCRCVIVLKIANYTAEFKQILVNYYLYSVFPVASILAVSLQLHPQCSILVLLSFKEPSCSHSYFYHGSLAFPWTSPQVHFLESLSVLFFKHMLRFSSPSSTALLSSQRPGSCILIED